MRQTWRSGVRRPPGALRRRPAARLVLAAAALVVVVVALVGVGLRSGASADTRGSSVIGVASSTSGAPTKLPQLGTTQVVEYDDVGDPFILDAPHGVQGDPAARYVLFWTTDWRSNVPTAVSSDLVHWQRVADALPVLPSWATDSRTMTWGPSALPVSGGWVLYFGTQDASNHLQCIGSAFSSNPSGPYVDSSPQPLVCQPSLGGSIDPSVVRNGGTTSLLWKSDGNATGAPVSLWQQPLSTNGRSLVGTRTRLLSADQPWQRGIVEGPSMLAASKGGWWLFYSGGSWQSNTYATGVAWCASVAGPCTESSSAPFLAGLPSAVSPGGLETFRDNGGRLWASYSAFPSRPPNARAAMGEDRVLEIAPITSH